MKETHYDKTRIAKECTFRVVQLEGFYMGSKMVLPPRRTKNSQGPQVQYAISLESLTDSICKIACDFFLQQQIIKVLPLSPLHVFLSWDVPSICKIELQKNLVSPTECAVSSLLNRGHH